jgi:predicted transcriptional regulator
MSGVFTIKKNLDHSRKQSKVLKLILKSPGVRYRQLLRTTGLSNGSLSNILRKLENSRSIIVNRTANNRATAYYPKNINISDKVLQEGNAKMHLGEAMKALQSGDTAGAEMHAQVAQDSL